MRISKQEYFMLMALLCSTRATCARRSVGCVLVDGRSHVLSTGYNGPVSGMPHCIDKPCAGVGLESGHGLDLCEAVHAEENALIQCKDVYAIRDAYCTTLPCPRCLRQLMNTSCLNIYYLYDYGDAIGTINKWKNSVRSLTGREMYKMPMMRVRGERHVEDEYCEWENICG